ncbi:hypothetical protein [Vibrio parahaemolyticus]|uniref:hypothetical protein n=1 Tax=Vibrio parahaemolyticus TaxID=670 RepID=UPI0023614C5F|nr:hypothetical protein [Vibrio parahaemolyticus]MDF5346316.1 hypothetical protein [Vibrio parahaemolyticus]
MEERLERIKSFIGDYHERFAGSEKRQITNWDEIKEITSFFIDHGGKSPIVDFIDLSNWDSVQYYTFNDENRTLELVWHDFREDDDDDGFMRECFGADVIKAEIQISSVTVVANKGIPVLFFKAYYREQKELNLTYNKGCSEMKFLKSHPFSVEIGRIVKRKLEFTTIPNVSCYTVSIVPDCARFISSLDSKELLYAYNIHVVSEKLSKLLASVGNTDEDEQEELHTFGNQARKHFENALKVLNLRGDVDFDKDYQKLMLGDLTSILKNLEFADELDFSLQNVLFTLNKCSHDAGVFISKDEVYKAVLFIVAAINRN